MHLHYDIAERYRQREAAHDPVPLTPEIFRAYDIRGVIDKTLDSGIAHQIGQAVGSAVLERDACPVVVARDGRLSGPYLMKGIIEGLVSTGCDVIDIGAAPTGVLYYAAHEYAKGSAIVITGSHNPPDYNGFKIMVGGDTLHGDAIRALYERIVRNDLKTGQGKVERRNVIKNYILRIAEDIKVERPLRVVLDCGNGIGGTCAPDVLRAIGVDTGGSNIQFAVNPADGRMVVIEMNPRVSRSSALASKATGFPIARISSLLAGGLTLDEIPYWRDGTLEKYTPSGDYVVVKFARWAFEKFKGVEDKLGTQMRAVGEVMSIGKNYKEAFQKAIRSLEKFPFIVL